MKNPGGFYADDFDEACAWLTDRDFRNARGENTSVDARTDRSEMMVSPSGFAFDLSQHIKDRDQRIVVDLICGIMFLIANKKT